MRKCICCDIQAFLRTVFALVVFSTEIQINLVFSRELEINLLDKKRANSWPISGVQVIIPEWCTGFGTVKQIENIDVCKTIEIHHTWQHKELLLELNIYHCILTCWCWQVWPIDQLENKDVKLMKKVKLLSLYTDMLVLAREIQRKKKKRNLCNEHLASNIILCIEHFPWTQIFSFICNACLTWH